MGGRPNWWSYVHVIRRLRPNLLHRLDVSCRKCCVVRLICGPDCLRIACSLSTAIAAACSQQQQHNHRNPEAFRLQQRFLLDEFAFHRETTLGGTSWQQMKNSGAFELLQLTGTANDLPHSIVQELRLAVRPRDEYRLNNPFDVGLVAIRRSEFQITARLAANSRHDVVSAIFLNRRAGEWALT